VEGYLSLLIPHQAVSVQRFAVTRYLETGILKGCLTLHRLVQCDRNIVVNKLKNVWLAQFVCDYFFLSDRCVNSIGRVLGRGDTSAAAVDRSGLTVDCTCDRCCNDCLMLVDTREL
jgi:hypothetical protein